jgi:hypothetical protein
MVYVNCSLRFSSPLPGANAYFVFLSLGSFPGEREK